MVHKWLLLLGLGHFGYFLGAVVLWLVASHYLSMMTNTLYLHRYGAHRSFEMHWFFKWLCATEVWIKSGMKSWYWFAVHRKHHAFTDVPGDPHSPKIFGNWRVTLGQAFYYRRAIIDDPDIMKKYVPEMEREMTWYDRYIYCSKFANPMGPVIFLLINCVLFGLPAVGSGILAFLWSFWPGVLAWLILINDVPIAGGAINGLGHWGGKIRNILKIDFLFGGEALHKNHHQFPWSAYVAHAKGEFDPGKWQLQRVLGKLGLAKNAKYPGPNGEHLIDPLV